MATVKNVRILPEREKIALELQEQFHGLTPGMAKKLSLYVMRHKNDQAYTSYRLGFADAKAGKELTDREAYEQLPDGHGARG